MIIFHKLGIFKLIAKKSVIRNLTVKGTLPRKKCIKLATTWGKPQAFNMNLPIPCLKAMIFNSIVIKV
jgi:hypothetical protein